MAITLRGYQGPEDLHRQQGFWVQATRPLPWCWKPTVSPLLYSQSPQFDPRSRCFAFEGNRLVGYCSFTGQGQFVSLGYPWVLPEYEGELQEKLYDAVYGFAASDEYGGRTFAQRFRQPWTAQISFFERHGFVVQRRDPIYGLDLRPGETPRVAPSCDVACSAEFCWDDFRALSEQRLPAEQLNMWRQYFATVDFDFTVKASREGVPLTYFGLAIRSDTGFAEIIGAALDPAAVEALRPSFMVAMAELLARNATCLEPVAKPQFAHRIEGS